MKTVAPSALLKFAFIADAAGSGAIALLQLGLSAYLGKLLLLPPALLLGTGLFLVGYTALLVVLATSKSVWPALVQFVVIGNVGWALACIGLMLTGIVEPGALGIGFLLIQAVAVLVFAALEWMGLASSTVRHGLTPAHA